MTSADEPPPVELEPTDFLSALLKISPQDAAEVRAGATEKADGK